MKSYDALMQALYNGQEAYVTFRKQDGTLRDMRCTMGADGQDFGNYARVWDRDEKGYRTILRHSLLMAGW
jgi:hypothetical protein